MIHSSPEANRGSHFACTSGEANSCSSRIPPVCSWYIWPMLESPAEISVHDLHQVHERAAVPAELARDHQPEQAGSAERRALLVGELRVAVALGGADAELVAQLRSATATGSTSSLPGTGFTASWVLIVMISLGLFLSKLIDKERLSERRMMRAAPRPCQIGLSGSPIVFPYLVGQLC